MVRLYENVDYRYPKTLHCVEIDPDHSERSEESFCCAIALAQRAEILRFAQDDRSYDLTDLVLQIQKAA